MIVVRPWRVTARDSDYPIQELLTNYAEKYEHKTTLLRIILAVLFCVQLGSLSSSAEQIEENLQPYVIYKPDPYISPVAIRRGWGGKITCELKINAKTGLVDEVKVVRHTGYPTLDAEAVMTLFKWKFRPNTITHGKVTYELGVLGRGRILH
jgi:TonB family protein